MSLIKNIIKLAVPLGTLTYTKDLELWSRNVGSQDAEKRFKNQKDILDSYLNLISKTTEPYLPQIVKEDVLNVSKYWNCGIFIIFKTITEYDYLGNVSKLGLKLKELLNTVSDNKSSN